MSTLNICANVGPWKVERDSLKQEYDYRPMCNRKPNHDGNHQLRVGDRVIDEWEDAPTVFDLFPGEPVT